MKAALLQLNASDDPVANLAVTVEMVRDAAAQGAVAVQAVQRAWANVGVNARVYA